jgi:tol-pal system protein YbgF
MIGQDGMGMRRRQRWLGVAALVAAAVVLPPFASLAQQTPPGTRPPQVSAARPGSPAAKDAAPSSDAALQRRVEQLEEQLVDLQVVIGTLESLAKGGAGPASSPAAGMALSASDAGRLDALETQIRALAAQLENLQEQVRGIGGGGRGSAPGGFGSVSVAPETPKDDLDKIFPPAASGRVPQSPSAMSEAEPQPQQLYERAYGLLLQKDYGTAESSFEDFLKRHPTHPLAGNAQYWLGETFYVRAQYRPAAAAFLKGYQDYAKSQKAPESLLKLAMSLQRLGQKDAACSSHSEFAAKFPNPPAHIKSLAQAERTRSGC